jgi:hypothetical protein
MRSSGALDRFYDACGEADEILAEVRVLDEKVKAAHKRYLALTGQPIDSPFW